MTDIFLQNKQKFNLVPMGQEHNTTDQLGDCLIQSLTCSHCKSLHFTHVNLEFTGLKFLGL